MIIQVDEKVYRGTSQDALKSLNPYCYDRILNLQLPDHYENMKLITRGFTPIHLAMGAIFPPTKIELEVALEAIIFANGKILVHCHSGVDRTGMVIAYYRMKICGWGYERAVKEMFDMGMHWFYKPFWPKALLKMNYPILAIATLDHGFGAIYENDQALILGISKNCKWISVKWSNGVCGRYPIDSVRWKEV